MARIKVEFPENVLFETLIPVRITDLNYGGHLGNDSLVTLAQEARIRFYQHFNYTELNIEGLGTILYDLAVEYKKEVFYGDVLKFEIAVSDFHKYGFTIYYRVSNAEGKLVALIQTGILTFDYSAHKKASLPQEAAEKFGGKLLG